MRKEPMTEREFDLLLETSLPEVLPSDVPHRVNPWRRAMDRILLGFAFQGITLNFLLLQYILPAIGAVLLLLGFRSLRRENVWFRLCYVIAAVNVLELWVVLVLNGTLYSGAVSQGLLPWRAVFLGVNLVQLFCFWLGFRAVRQKAGLEPGAASAFALLVWNAILGGLALMGAGNMPILLGVGILALYLCILRCLWTLSTHLDEAGYVVQAAPVRVEDGLVAKILAGVLAVGLAVGYGFFGSYPMEWTPAVETGQQDTKAHLVELGVPEQVADDLTAEDLAACAGATEVVIDQQYHSITDGVTTESTGEGDELLMTHVALQLDEKTWKIIHHFQWVVHPGFRGTENIQFWPTDRENEGWESEGQWTGRLLYDKDGQTYTAPYYSLESVTYDYNSWFSGQVTVTDVFAAFSLPKEGENHRGYASYTIREVQPGWIVNSWMNYTHQLNLIQYPVQTATAHEQSGAWSNYKFLTIQDALQFSIVDGVVDNW